MTSSSLYWSTRDWSWRADRSTVRGRSDSRRDRTRRAIEWMSQLCGSSRTRWGEGGEKKGRRKRKENHIDTTLVLIMMILSYSCTLL